jgi:hypothetical protein
MPSLSLSLTCRALTFGVVALLGLPLTPAAAFTSMALFQVLIAPLNAFPWVVTGGSQTPGSPRCSLVCIAPMGGHWWVHTCT